jgi:hypothetical protein
MKLELSDITNMKELDDLKKAMDHYEYVTSMKIGTMQHRMADDGLNYAERQLVNKFKEWINDGLI